MARRHVVHETTRDAVLERHVEGESFREMASALGDQAMKAALSAIVRRDPKVGRHMERKIRVGLGLSPRALSPSEVKRAALSRRLRAARLTWMQAIEIALEKVEGA